MPSHYLYRCTACGHTAHRYRNSTKCRECGGDIVRVMPTLDEYVEARIHDIFTDVAEQVANGEIQVDDSDIAAGIPMTLFQADAALTCAWRAYLNEMPGQEPQP